MNAYLLEYQETKSVVVADTKKEAKAYYQGFHQMDDIKQLDARIVTHRERNLLTVLHNDRPYPLHKILSSTTDIILLTINPEHHVL